MPNQPFNEATIRRTRRTAEPTPPAACNPKAKALVNNLVGRVADKWTMTGIVRHGRVEPVGPLRTVL